MKLFTLLSLCTLLLSNTYAFAETDSVHLATLSEEDYLGEVPQVLTIARLRQSASDVPIASTVIDRETIRAAGIIDLPEVFRLVPGFYVGTNAGFIQNTNHVVSYHGMTDAYSRSMQVMIDGRSIYQPLYGGVQWSEIPITINDIERIEITRGPNAASYGANAFLGTINIITQSPTGASGNRVSLNHGNGRNEAFYHHSGGINNLNYRISAGYREDDGLSNRADFKRTNLINARANLKLSDMHDVDFQFGYAEGKREEGDEKPDALLFTPRTHAISNHYEMVKWNMHFSPKYDFYVQAFHTRDNSDDVVTSAALSAPASPSVQSFRNPYNFDRYDIETQLSAHLSDDFQYAVGGSIRRDRLYSPFWIGSDKVQTFDLKRLFAQTQYDIHPKLTLNGGFMIEDNDFTNTDFSPRASMNIHVTPHQTFRIGYSEAFRTPSYLEEKFRGGVVVTTTAPQNFLYQRFFNEGNLKPEKIQSREIGYVAKWANISIDAKLFHDTIDDYITEFDNDNFIAPPNTTLVGGDVGTFRNQGSTDTHGFETQILLSFTPDTKLMLNYAHIKNRPNNIKENEIDDVIDATPRDIASFLLTHRFNSDWDASFAGYYNSPVRAFGDGNPVDSNHRFDARIAKRFRLAARDGEVSLNVQNLTDRHEKEFATYNTLRRRAFVNVRLDF
ncbi:MAG: TonB-dependent receptor [Methylophilus sp.]|nr:TonB-dependent receptor [Methylophilus sp.]